MPAFLICGVKFIASNGSRSDAFGDHIRPSARKAIADEREAISPETMQTLLDI